MGSADDSVDEQPTVADTPSSSRRVAGSTPRRTEQLSDVLPISGSRLRRLSIVGRGGFGSVEIAVDSVLQRRLAMKVVHTELNSDELTLQLFAREAMITAQLDHPNIVPVHDVGHDEHQCPYFTMKLVEGRSLAQLINAAERPLSSEALRNHIDVVIKLCDALSFAHSRGVLHCDVKSDNIMVGDFGQVYLMDWGAAQLLPDSDVRLEGPLREAVGLEHLQLPREGCVLGTPGYMAPEQARGERASLDGRADVYSLGAVLYHIITGQPPQPAGASQVTSRGTGHSEPIPAKLPPGAQLPAELERIVMKALATDPDCRYPSIGAFRDALVAFTRGENGFPQVSFDAGATIISEGDEGVAAYIIVSGRCEVFHTVDGKPRTLRHMGPGEVFGEAAILSPGPRTASVVAREPTSLLVIDRAELQAEVGALKPWLAKVLRTLASRFRDSEAARVYAEFEQTALDEPID